jgi:hypothetical protein
MALLRSSRSCAAACAHQQVSCDLGLDSRSEAIPPMRACVRRTTACWLWWALPTFASGNDERIAGAQSHIHDGRATDGLLQIVEFLPAILDTAHEKRVEWDSHALPEYRVRSFENRWGS